MACFLNRKINLVITWKEGLFLSTDASISIKSKTMLFVFSHLSWRKKSRGRYLDGTVSWSIIYRKKKYFALLPLIAFQRNCNKYWNCAESNFRCKDCCKIGHNTFQRQHLSFAARYLSSIVFQPKYLPYTSFLSIRCSQTEYISISRTFRNLFYYCLLDFGKYKEKSGRWKHI